ncbi:hypothetical protein B0H14DRAFT_2843752 [Mycena olivaceomarginata]|uniref:Uncharacterized protein n=1 Tax=Mycena albidolilacea TaxID=1033008 RepID=A0AAD7ASH7_9AGAR|nr:hypothetical protein DFH08DRAFT_836700 [Mycena albidolilacea]KAJ7713851.1 hypothetical protein B0H14DRAFT_3015845 [Mycena olivaceomarginata]KAJ7816948.1 hypothetical protein B0H14DRAFT_2843752 [Mycena olivaceomarginata]
MGKSAKLHKRPKNLKKPSTGGGSSNAAAAVVGGGAQAQAQIAKKKAGLKQKAAGKSTGEAVLRSADYVSLMGSSRRKAREEAAKMQRN